MFSQSLLDCPFCLTDIHNRFCTVILWVLLTMVFQDFLWNSQFHDVNTKNSTFNVVGIKIFHRTLLTRVFVFPRSVILSSSNWHLTSGERHSAKVANGRYG